MAQSYLDQLQAAVNSGDWTQLPGGAQPYFSYMEQKAGLPAGYLSQAAAIESQYNPAAVSPTGATGLFQFTAPTAADYGLSSNERLDPFLSTAAAAGLARDNYKALSQALGRPPTAGELYLAHQEGVGGATAILKANPNSAISSLGAQIAANIAKNPGGSALPATIGQWTQRFLNQFSGAQQYAPSAAGAYDPSVFGSGTRIADVPDLQDPSQTGVNPVNPDGSSVFPGVRGLNPASAVTLPDAFGNSTTTPVAGNGSLGDGLTPLGGYSGNVDPTAFGATSATTPTGNGSFPGVTQYGDVSPTAFGANSSTQPAAPGSLADGIRILYAEALGRDADATGLQGWENQLQSGKTWGDVANGIVGSTEYAGLHQGDDNNTFVRNAYQAALGRDPSQSEVNNWVNAINGGATRGSVLAGINGSQEAAQSFPTFGAFSQTSPAANGSLGAGITPASYNGNVDPNAFAAGSSTTPTTNGSLGAGITPSNAYNGAIDPGAFGTNTATTPVGNGSFPGVEPDVSPTAFGATSNTTPTANGNLGDGITPLGGYNGAIDPGAFGTNTATTPQGQNPGFGAGITPDPYLGNLTSLYTGILGRAPDQTGLTGWENSLNSGASYDSVASGIWGSPESQAKNGGNTQPLKSTFNNVFGRDIDTSGWGSPLGGSSSPNVSSTAFGSNSTTSPTSNGSFGTGITPSSGYNGDVGSTAFGATSSTSPTSNGSFGDGISSDPYAANLNGLYSGILGRGADQAGLTGWEKAINDGAGYDSIAMGIWNSPEAQAKWGGDTSALNGTFNNLFGRNIDPNALAPLGSQGPSPSASSPSPTGNAWSDSYLATNAITNQMNASANQGAETLMNNSAAAQNQMLGWQQLGQQQTQNQLNNNLLGTQAMANPANFGSAAPAIQPTFQPFQSTASFSPVFF